MATGRPRIHIADHLASLLIFSWREGTTRKGIGTQGHRKVRKGIGAEGPGNRSHEMTSLDRSGFGRGMSVAESAVGCLPALMASSWLSRRQPDGSRPAAICRIPSRAGTGYPVIGFSLNLPRELPCCPASVHFSPRVRRAAPSGVANPFLFGGVCR